MWIRRKKRKNNNAISFNSERVFLAATQPLKSVFSYFDTSRMGLTEGEVTDRLRFHGPNEIVREKRDRWLIMFIKTFINPFIGILMALAVVSLVIDVLMAAPEDREWVTVIVITAMVMLSAVLRFVQEWKSGRASDALKRMVKIQLPSTAWVQKTGRK